MKKLFAFGLASLLVFGWLGSWGYSQDASDIINKMIEASGGRKVLEGIKDTTLTGEMEITQMGLAGTITMYHKEPNLFRQDIEVMGMVITNAFDGEVAWMVNPQTGSVEELPESAQGMSERSALEFGNSPLLYPDKYGITFAFKGKEKVDGIECLVIDQTFENGDVNTQYIDASTYLTYKAKSKQMGAMGGEVDQEMVFSDFREVDGVMYPHSLMIYQNGEEFAVMTITELSFNTGLEDSLFQME